MKRIAFTAIAAIAGLPLLNAAQMQLSSRVLDREEEVEEEVSEEMVQSMRVTEIKIVDITEDDEVLGAPEKSETNREGAIDVNKVNEAVRECAVMPESSSAAQYSKPEKIYEAVEMQAEFPGGHVSLMKWLSQNLRYPEIAQQENIEGRVIVKMTIEKDGSVSNPVIAKGIDKDLNKEAIRVVKSMPKWKPAKNGGEAVRSYFYLPVVFKLTSN